MSLKVVGGSVARGASSSQLKFGRTSPPPLAGPKKAAKVSTRAYRATCCPVTAGAATERSHVQQVATGRASAFDAPAKVAPPEADRAPERADRRSAPRGRDPLDEGDRRGPRDRAGRFRAIGHPAPRSREAPLQRPQLRPARRPD